jgi:phenylpyruvate tautomerase PptA (4-oxalocrotonate tautomerase family)
MPMIDVLIPEGALKPEAEERLLKELTDILITHEGFDPSNMVAQSVSVVFLHRPAVLVGGNRSATPRHRIIPTVPEGQYNDASRTALVKDVTDAVVRADGGKYEDVAPLVWVFPTEIPDGQWGGRGVSRPLPDIQAFIAGEHERKVGEERLARRRREKALAMLERRSRRRAQRCRHRVVRFDALPGVFAVVIVKEHAKRGIAPDTRKCRPG